mmetsp:Transcript_22539/g.90347  ORF Transcript_22539/g.90347 Transcript_22539/m.90347 type:complete len:87 (+) Transcript_22539:420-680(+)
MTVFRNHSQRLCDEIVSCNNRLRHAAVQDHSPRPRILNLSDNHNVLMKREKNLSAEKNMVSISGGASLLVPGWKGTSLGSPELAEA